MPGRFDHFNRAKAWSGAALAASALMVMAAPAHAQINLVGSLTDVSCNGGANGTATVTAAGGAGSYTYSWAPSGGTAATATGLTAGSYTVTVNDGFSPTATKNFTITQPTALSATTAKYDVSVNGGSDGQATVTASGGTPGYTYSWSPTGGVGATATGLPAGAYTVTITDANSCSVTRNITITQPAPAVAAAVASVAVPANGAYVTGDTLNFMVNFDQTVVVDTTGGTPRLALTIGATTRYANYVSGSGASALQFAYTIQAGDADADGIAVGALGLNGGTIRNGSMDVILALNSVASTSGVLVTATPPPAPVPTLTEWAMILLTGLLALFGAARLGFLPARKN